MADLIEYIVTTADLATTEEIQKELTQAGSTVDTIPERKVAIADERPINARNTNYFLTREEAEALKNDPRVEGVFNPKESSIKKFAVQDGNFTKVVGAAGERQNWGLLRHTTITNPFGTSQNDPGGTYNYVLDGTGVDIVIVDSGIQADHPEFQDSEGNSRVQQIDWFVASGVVGVMPPNHYTDFEGHGTHVAATAAGKTFGWAKNAHIYSIKVDGLQGASDPNGGISSANVFDCILGWHNAKTNGRPTVINNSWGYVLYFDTALEAISYDGVTYYDLSGGRHRGVDHTTTTKDVELGLTGQQISATEYVFTERYPSVDADIAQLVAAGVIVCNAAGNQSMKQDLVGGIDYNNFLLSVAGAWYYHRGGSPSTAGLPGFEVGSFGSQFVSGTEAKTGYSDTGPNIDIYAAGDRIISAMSTINDYSSNTEYYLNTLFKQEILNGTSMASPQVAGMCALLLQAHPDWTPTQVHGWMTSNAKSTLQSTGLDYDYGTVYSLLGGANRLAYFPLNGQKTFTIGVS